MRENVGVFRTRFAVEVADRRSDLWTLRELRIDFASVAATRVRDRSGATRAIGRVRVTPIESIAAVGPRRLARSLPQAEGATAWRVPWTDAPPVPFEEIERLRFYLRARVDRFGSAAAETAPPLFSEEIWIALRAPRDPFAVARETPPPPRPDVRARIRSLLAAPRPVDEGDTTLVRLLLLRGDVAARLRLSSAWDGGAPTARDLAIRAAPGTETEILWILSPPPGAREGRIVARLERTASDSEEREISLPVRPRADAPLAALPEIAIRLDGPREAGAEGEVGMEVRATEAFEGTASISFGSGDSVSAHVRLAAGERTRLARARIPLPPGLWEVAGEVRDARGRARATRAVFDIDPLLPDFDPLEEIRIPAQIPVEAYWDGLLRIPAGGAVEVDFPLPAPPGEFASTARVRFARAPAGWSPPERIDLRSAPSIVVRNPGRQAAHLPPPHLVASFAPGSGVRLAAAEIVRPDPASAPTAVRVRVENADRVRPPRAARIRVADRTRSVRVPNRSAREIEFPIEALPAGFHEIRVGVEENGGGETVVSFYVAGAAEPLRLEAFAARTPRGVGVLHRLELVGRAESARGLRFLEPGGAEAGRIEVLPAGEEAWTLAAAPCEVRDEADRVRAAAPPVPSPPAPSVEGARVLILPADADETPAVGVVNRLRVLLVAGEAPLPAGTIRLAQDGISARSERTPALAPGEAALLALAWRPAESGLRRALVWVRTGSAFLADQARREVGPASGPGAWDAGFVAPARYRRLRDDPPVPPLPADLAFEIAATRVRAAAADSAAGPRAGTLRRTSARALASAARDVLEGISTRDLSAGAGPGDLEALAAFGERAGALAVSPRPVPPGEVGRRAGELEELLRILLYGREISVDALGRFRSISVRDGT